MIIKQFLSVSNQSEILDFCDENRSIDLGLNKNRKIGHRFEVRSTHPNELKKRQYGMLTTDEMHFCVGVPKLIKTFFKSKL